MVLTSGGGAGNFIQIICDVAGSIHSSQRSVHPARSEEMNVPFSSFKPSYFFPPAASTSETSFQLISTSIFAAPLLVRRTFPVSVFPLRRNSVTSAVTPGQFVSCDCSDPPADAAAGAVEAAAGGGAAACVVDGAGSGAGEAGRAEPVAGARAVSCDL